MCLFNNAMLDDHLTMDEPVAHDKIVTGIQIDRLLVYMWPFKKDEKNLLLGTNNQQQKANIQQQATISSTPKSLPTTL